MAMTPGSYILGAITTGTSCSATITSPSASDHYIAMLAISAASTTGTPGISGVTGMTWTAQGDLNTSAGRFWFWIGTGGTATGTATATWGSQSRTGQLTILPVTGVTGYTIPVAAAVDGSSSFAIGASVDGPLQTPAVGDLVIGFGRTSSANNTVDLAYTPSGWTEATDQFASAGTFFSAYKVAASTATHKATSTNNSTNVRASFMAQMVVRFTVAGAPHGAGAGAFQWAGVGTGHKQAHATGVGAFGFVGVGSGHAVKRGAGSGAYVFAGSGTGHAPLVSEQHGSGTGAFSFAGVGSGHTVKHGAGSGAYNWAGTSTSHAEQSGSGTGAFAWAGVGSGTAPGGIPSGSGSGSFGWVGEGLGRTDRAGETWAADLSQRTLLAITTAVTSPTFVPPLAAIPASVVEHPITRASVVVPDPTTLDPADVRTDPRTGRIVIRDDVYAAFPVTTEIVGVPHVIIDGRDVTYFRDSRTIVRNDQAAEPFGDQALVVEFPQIDSMDDPADPDLSWLATDKPVHYVMQLWDEDGPTGEVQTLFSGFLVSDDTGNDETTLQTVWTARGDLYAGAMFAHLPRLLLNQIDIGTQVPKVFNGVTNRPYGTIPAKATGITTLQRGNPGDKVMSYAQSLLADAWTTGGNQWTVAKKPGTRNSYEVRQKKTGVDWIVTNGQYGVSIDLSADRTQHPNVIYGRGQRTDGGVWMNKKFPEAGKTAPDYPFTVPGSVMTIGTTDATTSTGDGVSTWQRRAIALGARGITVDGVFGSADYAAALWLQHQYGIQEDGIVGPQTWAETFDVGALGADPDSWVRLPLAWVPGTQKRRYSATGVDLGPDPDYDPTKRVVSDDVDMGTDVSLTDGVRSAQQIIDRGNPLPLTGTITLTTDPRQGWRGFIQAGDRIQVIGYKGRNVTLHIADRGRDWTGKGPITLQVAEKPTDALTLAQIKQRNNANRADPARRPGKIRTKPTIDPWDCESNAGQIERRAQYGGLWSVTRMPMSEVGRIARLNLTCSSATEFAFFIFAKQITSAQMIRYVGANPSSIADPGSTNRELLEDRFGWIEGFGGSNGMLGHFPNGPDGAVTGRAQESGIDYYSPDQYLYLAIWTASSTFIEGDMRAAPPEA